MTPDERWLAAEWPFVAAGLPAPPGTVLEIGCGKLGGFVPRLRAAGYQATGVDPEAPPGPWFQQAVFGPDSALAPVDAMVACTSLHHVANLAGTLDVIGEVLAPRGVVLVIEWARERFDERTARWCMSRLPAEPAADAWPHDMFARWLESGQSWDCWCPNWAAAERMHSGADVLAALASRFDTEILEFGPYFFSDLPTTTEADEQAAIDAGEIAATRIQYRGRKRPLPGGQHSG